MSLAIKRAVCFVCARLIATLIFDHWRRSRCRSCCVVRFASFVLNPRNLCNPRIADATLRPGGRTMMLRHRLGVAIIGGAMALIAGASIAAGQESDAELERVHRVADLLTLLVPQPGAVIADIGA